MKFVEALETYLDVWERLRVADRKNDPHYMLIRDELDNAAIKLEQAHKTSLLDLVKDSENATQ
jgi:hypothetical protein